MRPAAAALLGVGAAGASVAAPHDHQSRKTPARQFDRRPVKPERGQVPPYLGVTRRAVADQGQRIALRTRSAYQQRFKTGGTRGGHRNAQLFQIKFGGGGPHGRKDDYGCQREAHHFPSKPRCSQGWNFSRISPVSGVGLRVASSSNTDTDRAEATQMPSENTT